MTAPRKRRILVLMSFPHGARMKEVNQQQAVKNDNKKNTCFTGFCRDCRGVFYEVCEVQVPFFGGEDVMCLFTSPGNGANWTHDSDFHGCQPSGSEWFLATQRHLIITIYTPEN